MDPQMNLTHVFTAEDNLQAEMIIAVFKSYSIPSIKIDLGNAGLMNIYGGNSRYGESIYVPENNAEQARDILAGMGLVL